MIQALINTRTRAHFYTISHISSMLSYPGHTQYIHKVIVHKSCSQQLQIQLNVCGVFFIKMPSKVGNIRLGWAVFKILFHNNGSPRNLDIMTLYIHSTYSTEGSHNSHKIIFFGPIAGLFIYVNLLSQLKKTNYETVYLRIDFCDPSMLLHFIVSTAYIVCLVYSLREAIYVN